MKGQERKVEETLKEVGIVSNMRCKEKKGTRLLRKEEKGT